MSWSLLHGDFGVGAHASLAVRVLQVEAELKRLRAELDETNRVLDLTRSEQAKVQTK